MSDLKRAALRAALRRDLLSFTVNTYGTLGGSQPYDHNWHIELIADRLERTFRREIKRLLITLPPRHLKSICASVAFPAWALGQDPRLRFVCASYSKELATKHARDCRSVMASAWYREAFPATRINRKKSAEDEFETTKRGYRLSTSVGGTLTGRGGNFLIIDDPIKPQEVPSEAQRKSLKQWYDGTFYSRLDSKKDDVIILIMQRVHVDDLAAHVLEKENWEVLNLPAIAETPQRFELPNGRTFTRAPGDPLHPGREPLDTLKKIKENLGTYFFSAQYQQTPVPEAGNLVKWEWFRTYRDLPPAKSPRHKIVQSWDTAMKAHDGTDWSVCTTWAVRNKDYYLIDVYRERLDFSSLKKKVYVLRRQFDAKDVLIEDAGSGTGLIQQLRAEGRFRPIAVKPDGKKEDRLAAQSALIEAGHVLIPEGATWSEAFRAEILAFPFGKHDDQVDSLSQFLLWVSSRRPQRRVGTFTEIIYPAG